MLPARDCGRLGEATLPFLAILLSSCLNLMPDCGKVLVAERQLRPWEEWVGRTVVVLVPIDSSAERQLRRTPATDVYSGAVSVVSITSSAERQLRHRHIFVEIEEVRMSVN